MRVTLDVQYHEERSNVHSEFQAEYDRRMQEDLEGVQSVEASRRLKLAQELDDLEHEIQRWRSGKVEKLNRECHQDLKNMEFERQRNWTSTAEDMKLHLKRKIDAINGEQQVVQTILSQVERSAMKKSNRIIYGNVNEGELAKVEEIMMPVSGSDEELNEPTTSGRGRTRTSTRTESTASKAPSA